MVTEASGAAHGVRAHGRACGKLILLGEHAVVYGVPALAVGIARGLRAEAWRASAPDAGLVLVGRRSRDDATLGRAFAALCAPAPSDPSACNATAVAPVDEHGLAVAVEGDLTPGVGLGFSAAAAVAIARAVEALVHDDAVARAAPPDVEAAVAARAMAWERVFHGNPSGVDTAAAMHGGCIRFTRAHGPRPFAPARPFELCVGFTGTSASTALMVARVAALRAAEPARVDAEIAAIGSSVEAAIAALAREDWPGLGALMDRNHETLVAWGLSTSETDALVRAARGAGALGAKLSGSGGGGVVVALIGEGTGADPSPAARRVLDAWRDIGLSGFRTSVGSTAGASLE